MISNRIIGDVRPAVAPGKSPSDYGAARLTPVGPCPVRSFQTFEIVYTVGRFGLDDTGGIRIAMLWVYDGPKLQTTDPTAPNYVTAASSAGVALDVLVEPRGERPWDKVVRVTVVHGFLRPADQITVTIGDRRSGSPGFQMQTFCEQAFRFRVSVDACATDQFEPLDDVLTASVVPGPPARWRLVAPTIRRPGEVFALGVKAEDLWGNPTDQIEGGFRLRAEPPLEGLPTRFDWSAGARAMRFDGLRAATPGAYRITLETEGSVGLASSTPVLIRDETMCAYWGDLHGQSGETVGIDPAEAYFAFARDLGFLDATAHQGNDFQVNAAFWEHINALTAQFNDDGRFVVFPGYEWSGNSAVGGDHNVFFRHEGRPMRRSSHAMLADRADLDQDANDAVALFRALTNEDCVLFAHVGGRPADVNYAHDAKLRTAVEVHSDWGTFEWILTDSLALGHRVGVVANSDGHKGRTGASYPGAASFGAYGGLTCFRAPALTRDALFECLRRRHHYATSGVRLHLDVRARFATDGDLFTRDPHAFDTAPMSARSAMMGDIVELDAENCEIDIEIVAPSPVLRVDVLNGAETAATLWAYTEEDLGHRVRLMWRGAEHRGRGRQTRWTGRATVRDSRIERMTPLNAWNPERAPQLLDNKTLAFDAITTGNFGGADLWLESLAATLDIQTQHVDGQIAVGDLGLDDFRIEAGGLDRGLTLRRLPNSLAATPFARTVALSLAPGRDNPIWVRVATEDGHMAWSSPIYLARRPV